MREVRERSFLTHDGTEIFYRHWPSRSESGKAILLLHRGHEHSGRLAHVAEELGLDDYSIFAWDARAHGRSGGQQDSKTTMATFVQDLDEWVRHLCETEHLDEENIAVLAQSVGAVMAAAWVHDYAPRIRCLVLAAPAFQVKLYVPLARLGLTIWHTLVGDFFVNSYVKGAALTHDPVRRDSYATDPLIKRPISARVLLGLYEMSERLIEDAAAIRTPMQVLLSGRDWVVHNQPARRFLERSQALRKDIQEFPGFFHDILGEKERQLPIQAARGFLEQQFAQPATRPSLRHADQQGFTREEYDALRRPLPAWSPKGLSFQLTKTFLSTVGRLADGIKLGGDSGFDSGDSLDYVYRNQPSGWSPLGKIIDWFYLNSIGWRGIRVRRESMQSLLRLAVRLLRQKQMPARLLDIAAGGGRYVLEAGEKFDDILLRDFDDYNVTLCQDLSKKLRIPAHCERADAFDSASYAELTGSRTIGVVSGLFELFPENDKVETALAGLASSIQPGGYLLYTGQPWHPQLEMIARTLQSHRGAPWVMRRRTQEELDELVRAAGFRKVAQRMDHWGLFTVSLAERV